MSCGALCTLSFSTAFVPLLVIIHAKVTLHLSTDIIGLLLSSAGAGNILGIIVLKWMKNPNWMLLLGVLFLLSGVGVSLLCLAQHSAMICLGMFLFDGALSMGFVIQAAVHQAATPDTLLSRVRSVTYVLGGISGALGTFLAGWISQHYSTAFALWTGVIVLVTVATIMATNLGQSARIKEICPPDGVGL
nr:MFS transporter [Priestia koreensis]